jgi:hypothetical protein
MSKIGSRHRYSVAKAPVVSRMAATNRPGLVAALCGLAAWLLAIVGLYVLLGPPGPNADLPKLLGGFAATAFIPAIIAGVLAKRFKTGWSALKIVIVYIAVLVAVMGLQALGRSLPR